MAKICIFFHCFGFICQKKYIDFDHKLGIWWIKSKKYANFICELGKLAIQIKDDRYINWKTAQIEKIFNNFPKIWTEKVGMVSLMQNEGKTCNKKTMITFSSNDFSTLSVSRVSEFQSDQPIRTRFITYCGLIMV